MGFTGNKQVHTSVEPDKQGFQVSIRYCSHKKKKKLLELTRKRVQTCVVF